MREAVAVTVVALALSACPPSQPPPEPAPQPQPLRAGTATVLLDQPVGTAMGGYARARPASDPGSPWSKQLPASQGVHTEPTVRVLALSDGVTQAALVRLDLTIISPTLRTRVREQLARQGLQLNVMLYATHTHAGPARFMPPSRIGGPTGTDFVSLVMDHYDRELESRLVERTVTAITGALGSMERVSVGLATVDASAFNNDRRCENDPIYGKDFRDTDATVLRLDVVDDSGAPVRPLTALVHYAMHGTMLDSENTLQSTEVMGAVELYASDLTGVPVQFVQGAAGDVSPRSSPLGHDALQNIERQGRGMAQLVAQAWANARPGPSTGVTTLRYHERGVLIDRAAMGYAEGEFPESGALQCAAGGPGACGEYVSMPSEVVCFPLERKRPFRSVISLLQLGDTLFFSLPGEPGTGLTRKMETALASLGAARALPLGYAQDHFGYLLEENDWLRGGYEPTVSAYGWKFGPYLLSELEALIATLDQPQPGVDAVAIPDGGTALRSESLGPAVIVTQPDAGERLTTHRFVFEGGDPALGLPRVSLEQRSGDGFVPVMASPTRAIINGPELLVRYAATPTFSADPTATTRRHTWFVQFETLPGTPLGDYRFVARGQSLRNGALEAWTLISDAFAVTPSRAVTATAASAGDQLTLDARFPPNPTLYADALDDVVGNYRVRDDDADPRVGAHAHPAAGATLTVPVTRPDLTTGTLDFTWSLETHRWVSAPVTQPGPWTLTLAAGALRDAHGNDNRNTLTLMVTR